MTKFLNFSDASGQTVYINVDLVRYFSGHTGGDGKHWTTLHFSQDHKVVVQGQAHQLAAKYM